jgi:hypothetical protein
MEPCRAQSARTLPNAVLHRVRNKPQAAGKEKEVSRSRQRAQMPLTFHVNYGHGINSIDARGVVQMPNQPRLATTDFYQAGMSSNIGESR